MVSEESSLKIRNAIEKLSYIPNRNVRSIFGKKSGSIGVIIPSLINPFFSEMATLIGNSIQQDGNGMILCFTEDSPHKEEQAVNMLMEYRVDGIIVARSVNKNLYNGLDIPIVSFETIINEEILTISSDNYFGGKLAFEYLMENNCMRFILFEGPVHFKATNDRSKGFIDAAKKHNIEPIIISLGEDYYLESEVLYNEILRKLDFGKGDGIFAFNDITAISLMDLIQKNGFKIPQDIKIVGFDNSFISRYSSPSLSTIEQSVKEISLKCYFSLINLMEGNKINKNSLTIPVKIIKRDSA